MGSAPSYPLEMRAQAIALYLQYVNAERAARELRTIYGPDAPEESTVSRWCKRFRQVQAKEDDPRLLDDQYRVASRSYELIHDTYDYLDDQPGDIKAKFLFQFNAIAGTAADKIQQRNNPAVQVNILALIAQREASLTAADERVLLVSEVDSSTHDPGLLSEPIPKTRGDTHDGIPDADAPAPVDMDSLDEPAGT